MSEQTEQTFSTKVYDKQQFQITIGNDYAEFERTIYPIYPYANYIRRTIYIDASENEVELEEVRNNWDGTGAFPVNRKKIKNAKKLIEKLRTLKEDDVDAIAKLFGKLWQKYQ